MTSVYSSVPKVDYLHSFDVQRENNKRKYFIFSSFFLYSDSETRLADRRVVVQWRPAPGASWGFRAELGTNRNTDWRLCRWDFVREVKSD